MAAKRRTQHYAWMQGPMPSAREFVLPGMMRSRASAMTTVHPPGFRRGAWRMLGEMSVSSASKGTLFLSFHRKIGTASSARARKLLKVLHGRRRN